MQLITYIALFLLGISVGSFLYTLVYRRINKIAILNKRSRCEGCNRILVWWELLPGVNKIFLIKTGCQECHYRSPTKYAVAEVVMGLLFIIVSVQNAETIFGIMWWVQILIVCLLMYISLYDIEAKEIPIGIVYAVSFTLLVFASGHGTKIDGALMAGMLGWIFFIAQFIFSKGKWVGGGDAAMGMLMGVVLGWQGLLLGLLLAYILGAIIESIKYHNRKGQIRKKEIAFIPYLSIGLLVSLWWGTEIISWYTALI